MNPFKPGYRVLDHVDQGLARLLEQYKNRPRLRGWARAYLRQVQHLEDATYYVIIDRLIDRAVGVQLDALGRIVGERRKDKPDDLYRTFIGTRVRVNRSKGTTQDVLDVLYLITKTPLIFFEHDTANLLIELLEVPSYNPVLLLGMLRDTKAAGVGLSLISPTASPALQFQWGDAAVSSPPVSNHGFGNANALTTSFGLLSDAVTMRVAV